MFKKALLALTALSLVLVASCGPSFLHIQVRSVSEAKYLQAEAQAKGLRGDEIAEADKNLALAQSNKPLKASADYADLAAAYYRVALARNSVDESATTLNRAEEALKVSQEQVARYQDILTRVGGQ